MFKIVGKGYPKNHGFFDIKIVGNWQCLFQLFQRVFEGTGVASSNGYLKEQALPVPYQFTSCAIPFRIGSTGRGTTMGQAKKSAGVSAEGEKLMPGLPGNMKAVREFYTQLLKTNLSERTIRR